MAILDQQQETPVSTPSEMNSVSYTKVCNVCGKRSHTTNRCRFHQMTCYKCGKQGHLQVVCEEQVKQPSNLDKHTVKQLEQEMEQENEMAIWTITGGTTEGYYVHLKLNNKPTKMELDTGAAVSVMSDQQWKRMFEDTRALEPYRGKPLQGYAGHEVQVIGQVQVDITYGHQRKLLSLLIVARKERPPLFGHDSLDAKYAVRLGKTTSDSREGSSKHYQSISCSVQQGSG